MINSQEESLFKSLFNHLSEPQIVVKADNPYFTIVAYNQQYKNVSNIGERAIIGKGIKEIYKFDNIINSDGDVIVKIALNRVIAEKKVVKLAAVRYDLPGADGSTTEQTWWQAEYTPILEPNGEVEFILCTTFNITEQILNLEPLERLKEKEDALQREQVLNEELATANEELNAINEELHQSQQSLALLNFELEERVSNRTKALSDSETRFRSMVELSPVAMLITKGESMIFEEINLPMLELLGKDSSIKGKPWYQAVPEFEGQVIIDQLYKTYRTGEPWAGQEQPVTLNKNGKPVQGYYNFSYKAFTENGTIKGVLQSAIDVTEQVKARQTIVEREGRLRNMLETIPQMTWANTTNGKVSFYNQRWCTYTGLDFEQTQSWLFQKAVHPDDLQHTLDKYRSILNGNTGGEFENRYKRADGEYRWHLNRLMPIKNEEGNAGFWIGTATDIEDLKQIQQKKDEFLSIASHELKTPLTSIKAFNQLMKRTKDAEKLNNFVQKSSEHIFRLEKLISDLLDVTKINAGKMNYTMQDFSFKQMLQESIESVQHTSPLHHIILESVADVNYFGDVYRLEQVVHNFLSNAIKYSPEAVKVIVNCKTELGNIIVSIQDFGIGIAKDNLDRLFERYYREDNTAMRFEGLGLGLFISSEILKRHSGSFWIESEQGKGSVFYFRLPLAPENPEKQIIKTKDFYQDSAITISYNNKYERLDTDWKGFQNMETMQKGCMLILEMLTNNNCYKIVNDNRNVLGTWSEASEWVGEKFFPMMEKSGIKYFAWVFSPSVFSRLSAKKSVDMAVGNIITQFFTDKAKAEEWINSRPV